MDAVKADKLVVPTVLAVMLVALGGLWYLPQTRKLEAVHGDIRSQQTKLAIDDFNRAAQLFPEEIAGVIEANDKLALAEGGNHVAEEILTLGGKERVLVSERFPLTDYKGTVIGLCLVGRDYSRRRQLQKAAAW